MFSIHLNFAVLRSIHWHRKIEVGEGVEEKALKEKEEVWA